LTAAAALLDPPPEEPVPIPSPKADRATWVRDAIRAGQRYHYRTKNPVAHNARNLGWMMALSAGVGLVVSLGDDLHPALYLPIAPWLLGGLYFGLFILVVHEASHGMFFLSPRHRGLERAVNRGVGWAVAVWFAVHYTKHWEQGHLEHHVRPLEPDDPQRFSTLVGPALWKKLALTLWVPGFLLVDRTLGRQRLESGKSTSSKGVILGFVLCWGTAMTLAGLLVHPSVSIAIFLGLHVITALNHVKGALEHGGAIGREDDFLFRSRTSIFPGRRVLMPFNITFHFEHHLNFGVPWYDLGRYQRDLHGMVPRPVWEDVINHAPLDQLHDRLGGLRPGSRARLRP
jgi:fatty acid desaturase